MSQLITFRVIIRLIFFSGEVGRIREVVNTDTGEINNTYKKNESPGANVTEFSMNTVNSVNRPSLNNSFKETEIGYAVNRKWKN